MRVPELRPYYKKFAEDLDAFKKFEKEVREYHRLLVPPSQYLFLSSELRPLIAVASDLIAEGEPTFGEYVRNKSNYANLISKVRARAPAYQSTAGASNLAALLGVKEEPLPAPFSKKTPATGRETVWREGGTGIVKNEERGELPKRLERREGGDVYYDSGDEVGSAGITRMQSGGSRGVKSTSSEIQELRLYCEEQFQTWNAVIASMQARLEHLEARMSSS